MAKKIETPKTMKAPSHEAIATKAYLLWEEEGRKPGLDHEYWTRAEAQLLNEAPNRPKTRARSTRKSADSTTLTVGQTAARASAKNASPKPAVASRRKSTAKNSKPATRKRTS